ncbi:SPOR domain-containing protein, partial [Klebsiella pneumoniae]
DAAGMSQPAPTDVRPISNSTLTPADSVGAPVNSGGFLGAPTPLNNGVLESSEPAAAAAAAGAVAASSSATSSASGNFVVQVGAVSDQTRAQQYQQRLSQQFSVPGRVMQNGAVWRIQLGPFADKAQASAVQQRLQSEAQLQSFITRAN